MMLLGSLGRMRAIRAIGDQHFRHNFLSISLEGLITFHLPPESVRLDEG